MKLDVVAYCLVLSCGVFVGNVITHWLNGKSIYDSLAIGVLAGLVCLLMSLPTFYWLHRND